MKPSEVPEELIDLAMTGARPGCRYDAAFYLANVLPQFAEQAERERDDLTRRLVEVGQEWWLERRENDEVAADEMGAALDRPETAEPRRLTEQQGGIPNDAYGPGDPPVVR